jgi:hypothetical protein
VWLSEEAAFGVPARAPFSVYVRFEERAEQARAESRLFSPPLMQIHRKQAMLRQHACKHRRTSVSWLLVGGGAPTGASL